MGILFKERCPRCGNINRLDCEKDFGTISHIKEGDNFIYEGVAIYKMFCSDCEKTSIFSWVCRESRPINGFPNKDQSRVDSYSIYPRFPNRPVSPSVPNEIASDFREAVACLSVSPKASSILSRRCLQAVMQNKGATKNKLYHQIKELGDLKTFSSDMETLLLEIVKNTGDDSAHPNRDPSGKLIHVTTIEAEHSINVLEQLFDEVYVRPSRMQGLIANRKK